uniref:Uncharacterized protein n=1 Tax=Manihot esculenta TaxID=3983 RepID=A0A2C9VCH8_MANES
MNGKHGYLRLVVEVETHCLENEVWEEVDIHFGVVVVVEIRFVQYIVVAEELCRVVGSAPFCSSSSSLRW